MNHSVKFCRLQKFVRSTKVTSALCASAGWVFTFTAQAESRPQVNEKFPFALEPASNESFEEPQYTGTSNCRDFPSKELPVLKWCENIQTYSYEITTWNETKHFSKRKTKESIRKAILNFLAGECQARRLRFQTAKAELWLAVPWSGAELAQPRIGLQLDNNHFIFANAWSQKFDANVSNLHILGERNYATYSGDSLSGINPEKITFRPKFESPSGEIEQDLRLMLEALGVQQITRIRGGLPIFSASVARYHEQELVKRIIANQEIMDLIEWVEPSYKVETIGDRFNLYTEEIDKQTIPKQCK